MYGLYLKWHYKCIIAMYLRHFGFGLYFGGFLLELFLTGKFPFSGFKVPFKVILQSLMKKISSLLVLLCPDMIQNMKPLIMIILDGY